MDFSGRGRSQEKHFGIEFPFLYRYQVEEQVSEQLRILRTSFYLFFFARNGILHIILAFGSGMSYLHSGVCG